MIRPLIDQYGLEAVERAGIAALGYPAGWCRTFEEARRIQTHLDSERD